MPLRRTAALARPTAPAQLLRVLLAASLLVACGSTRDVQRGESIEVEGVLGGGLPEDLVAHPVYQASFEAVKSALDTDETAVARRALQRLQVRLEADLASTPTMQAARERGDSLSALVLAGDLPSRRGVQAAIQIADGFERVIDGRARTEALDLGLELTRRDGEELVDVALVARSAWPAPLTLRPGPGLLHVRRTSIEPRTGDIAAAESDLPLEDLVVLEVPPGGEARTTVATIEIAVPVGAIATRLSASLSFNGGLVVEAGERYPARDRLVPRASRTDFPGWVPLGYVDPLLLGQLARRGDAPLAMVLEHAVRIAPTRVEDALDQLGLAAEVLPPDGVRVLVPALRWLVGDMSIGLDEREWRAWLLDRLEDRRALGFARE